MRYWSVVSTMVQTYEVCMERDLSVFVNLSVYTYLHRCGTFKFYISFLINALFCETKKHQNKIIAEIFLDILFT